MHQRKLINGELGFFYIPVSKCWSFWNSSDSIPFPNSIYHFLTIFFSRSARRKWNLSRSWIIRIQLDHPPQRKEGFWKSVLRRVLFSSFYYELIRDWRWPCNETYAAGLDNGDARCNEMYARFGLIIVMVERWIMAHGNVELWKIVLLPDCDA